jgi:hypothetical protein
VAAGAVVLPDDGSAPAPQSVDASHGPDLSLQVTPATGLAAHDTVRLSLSGGSGGEVEVLQCMAAFAQLAPRRRASAIGGLCGPGTVVAAAGGDAAALPVAVQRRLVMSKATYDCGQAPSVCVLAVRSAGTDSIRFAPLAFAPGPLAEPVISVAGEGPPFADRTVVTVSGLGFAPGERLLMRQCREIVPAREPDEPPECDAAVRSRVATAGDDGSFSTPYTVFGVVATSNETDTPRTDWRLCGLCLLRVESERSGVVTTPLPMPTAGSPTGPRIHLTDPGPYAPGASVRVVGEGFQPVPAGAEPAGAVVLAWCVSDAPGAECIALPGAAPPVGPDGGFVAQAVPLPGPDDEVFGTRCADAPGACSLAWSDGEEVLELGQMVPLDLSG